MSRRVARVDANHHEIVAAFRKLGWAVQDLSAVGKGVPDLLVAHRGQQRVLLVEVKHGKGKLTADQAEWHERFPVTIVRTVDDVVALSGRGEGQ